MISNAAKSRTRLLLILLLATCLQLGSALYQRQQKDFIFNGVPTAPSLTAVKISALGDGQLAYRTGLFQLQHMGNEAGQFTPLVQYDMERVAAWLRLYDQLDVRSDYAPFLAAFYFALTPNKSDLRPLILYLAHVGRRNPHQKWRWLAHAVLLARHDLKDMQLALAMAYELQLSSSPNIPLWARQMPGFVLAASGNSQAAADFFNAMISEAPNLPPEEILLMQDLIQRYQKPQ